MTLVEVMVASVLLTVALFPVLNSLGSLGFTFHRTYESTHAAFLAQSLMEGIRYRLYDQDSRFYTLNDLEPRRVELVQERKYETFFRGLADAMYVDKLDGRVEIDSFDRKAGEWHREQQDIRRSIADHETANQNYLDEGVRLLELAQRAYQLFIQQDAREKRRLLDFVLPNSIWKAGELTVEYRKPFDLIASAASAAKTIAASDGSEAAKTAVWYPLRDSNPCRRRERAAS